ncbi:acetylornithine transaminase [Luteolibacter pohnpeiensis]|uniref:Acetylornithine transaminase n=1 Tax=Luteolibacter pohnpeiensis TaxID=454153 RepID=A0A934S8J1_9BACT|nr:acetylornithine transaminase [Luteolibacter pohnpeiensis]MBK1882811.1 acetylornithine transaminase [Luteolibacter pohnpeiensis]
MSDANLDQYTMPNYRRYDFSPERGEGSYLWDREGRKFLDFAGGVAVCPLGHSHPEVVQAIQEQAAKLIHVSNWYQIPQQGELAKVLVEDVLGIPGKCFFGNSGAEANEGLIKIARKYGIAKPAADGTPRHEILTFTGSFHGRTFATMTATAQEKVHGGFGPLVPGFKYLPFNDVAALEAAITPNTVAIMMEPVQGESGIMPATPEFLRAAAKLRDQHDLLLLLDEIQCGLGRTGEFGGWRAIVPGDEILPDAISWAKSIGSGYALGSFWARKRPVGDAAGTDLCDILAAGSHGSTYGGSPLACATALATLKVILRDQLQVHAKQLGSTIADTATSWELPILKAVRAFGCMIGFELNGPFIETKSNGAMPSIWIGQLCLDAGLLVVPAGPNVVRWLPPLNATTVEIEEGLSIFKNVLESVADR